MRPATRLAFLSALSLLLVPCLDAAPKGQMSKPDFLKGDPIPEGANHDWNLGATGARGWMFSSKLTTIDARQVAITKVAKGSPADGKLKVGDVLLGVGGKAFSYDPRTELGKALTHAESESGGGKLALTRWRQGESEEVTLMLPVLGTYSATAPYDCLKSQRILAQGCEALAQRMGEENYRRQNPITRSLNALALLASGEKKYLPLVKREAEWAADFKAESMATWWYGYTLMLLGEYVLATGDDSVMPGLRRMALEAANGQSIVGSWGHKFAGDDGRLVGYGMMNAPGVPLTSALVVARAAGVKDPEVSRAIERSAKLLRFYAGKGSVPYGDHAPWTQTHDDNGKNGMAAVLFNLLEEPDNATYFSKMSVASHGAERDGGHTGNFCNMTWAMPGVAQSGPNATGAWMKEFGARYFDLARRWDGSFLHQGPPAMKTDKYRNWDVSGAYLLAYAMPLKQICLTGKKPSSIPALDAATAQALIADGRGWNNKDRNSAYDALNSALLFERLGSWSPIVRGRAASALARRDEVPLDALIKLLDSSRIEERLGACAALAKLGGKAAPAVPALQRTLRHDDLWLRVQATEALAAMGEAGMVAVPELLERLIAGPGEDDPRGMEQRYLCFIVFGKMLKRDLGVVDRDLLRKAVAAGLQNEDGRARGSIGGIYKQLTYEEIKPLLPAIHEAIVKPSPSGIMFADGIRLSGIDLLAKHRIKEGMPLCFEVLGLDKWGKQGRIGRSLNTLAKYGGAAKPMIPRLRQLQKDLSGHRESRNLQKFADQIDKLIADIESAKDAPELRSLR